MKMIDYAFYLLLFFAGIIVLYVICRLCSAAIFWSYFEIKSKFYKKINKVNGGENDENN